MARMTIGADSGKNARVYVLYSDRLVAGISYRIEGDLVAGIALVPEDKPFKHARGYLTARDFTNFAKDGPTAQSDRVCVGVQVTSPAMLAFECVSTNHIKNIPLEEHFDEESGAVAFRFDVSTGYVCNHDYKGRPYGDPYPVRRIQPKPIMRSKPKTVKVQTSGDMIIQPMPARKGFTNVELSSDLVNAIEFMKDDGESISDYIARRVKG